MEAGRIDDALEVMRREAAARAKKRDGRKAHSERAA
jgi:translation elongation factor EF-Ts